MSASNSIDVPPRPGRIGIVLNPGSGYVRRHLQPLRVCAARIADATVIEASSEAQITHAVETLQLGRADLLVVIGGDGTLQAALTALLRLGPLVAPYVLALPAGTTNMSAADLGVRSKPLAALERLNGWLTDQAPAPSLSARAVLQVSDADQAQPRFGLFFGAGAIISGVRYFHTRVRPKGVRGALGPSLAFVRLLLALFRGREHSLLPATPARLHLGPHPLQAPWLLILGTTLNTLLLGSTPYWGREKAPMHFTAIAHRAPRLLPSLLPLLRGKSNETMRHNEAYVSHNLSHTTIDDLTEYLLDGEIFSSHGPLHLSTTPPIRFIVL
ncbi:diacylglycerol/lipid kinase family protein [Pseudomonas typographi]|uniref:Acylglycerol kinase family protein n=1 Tax=Pseudomonas typographi TaxID=2715964 RepID=A0ABR7Z8C7_9PSED|nr:acylglycerol kinase family protein [Pseudomonas typographi]MBD1552070.1 acylglycerol kinase family protein [Pseudomonas typographi]MBD1586634.1 acylglycerol kinase family protein [Pseudomonas typographi]MBD1601786.1 acylglycerol kinase family protein [Pseudomonas typographi]